jgi:site-specific recombinase XerD
MMSDSGTIYDLAEIMGHDDIETTKIYAHLSPKHLKKRMKNLDNKK